MEIVYGVLTIWGFLCIGVSVLLWTGWLDEAMQAPVVEVDVELVENFTEATDGAAREMRELAVQMERLPVAQPQDDEERTERSLRPAELAALQERVERTRRWMDTLPDDVSSETPADEPTVAVDLTDLRAESSRGPA